MVNKKNRDSFIKVRMDERNPKWPSAIKRQEPLYERKNEIRSYFMRDFNRILHCTAYRRLKHKTQVFFAARNDHICTRIEHVTHVASISYTIAQYLGLNTELTNAIAIGHDIGHAPFGHAGETFLKKIVKKNIGETFWHEKNSLRFLDKIETLADTNNNQLNLNLTYAVRDGVILHCGEVNETVILPRKSPDNLNHIFEPNQLSPYTWEGCIVKIADKISYLGRDIEDAVRLRILSQGKLRELKKILNEIANIEIRKLNNTVLMHDFICDLCHSSDPIEGIKFSKKYLNFIQSLTIYNYTNIYNHPRLQRYKIYASLVINTINNTLEGFFGGKETLKILDKQKNIYPVLINAFINWLQKYSDTRDLFPNSNFKNKILYKMHDKNNYLQAIIDFIPCMTDQYAIRVYNELTSF